MASGWVSYRAASCLIPSYVERLNVMIAIQRGEASRLTFSMKKLCLDVEASLYEHRGEFLLPYAVATEHKRAASLTICQPLTAQILSGRIPLLALPGTGGEERQNMRRHCLFSPALI